MIDDKWATIYHISPESKQIIMQSLGVTKLTPLDLPWICERCGYVRCYSETRDAHIKWHNR